MNRISSSNQQYDVDLSGFSKDVTEIFNTSITNNIKYDLLCQSLCTRLQASVVSILLYNSREDKLICNGNFYDASLLNSIASQPHSFVGRLINVFHYVKSYPRASNQRFENYFDSIFNRISANKTTNEEFLEIHNNWSKYNDSYEHHKKYSSLEKHSIEETTLTGTYYKQLLKLKSVLTDDIYVNEITNLQEEKSRCLNSLMDNLHLSFGEKTIYLALPLYATDRYFGVLRFIFTIPPGFINTVDSNLVVNPDFQERLNFISQVVSLQIETNYYLDGYKKMNLFEINPKKHNNVCEILSDIVNCTGVFMRIYNDETKKIELMGHTETLNEYKEYTKKNSDPNPENNNFSPGLVSYFQENLGKTEAIHFQVNKNKPFVAELNEFYFDKERNIKQSHKELKLGDFTPDYLEILELHSMHHFVLVPIPFLEISSFLVFTNTKNRDFTYADIEMILLLVKRIGLEYKHLENEIKIKEQEHAFALAEGMRTVIHQVGAPLAAIHNQLDNLAKGRIPQELIQKRSVSIGHQISYSKRQLTSFQRILELDMKPIAPQNITIENITNYLINKSVAFRAMANSKGIHIRVDKSRLQAPRFDTFHTDEKLLDEVLTCLLDNAVKYSFKESELLKHKISFDNSFHGSDGNILILPVNTFQNLSITITNWGCPILEHEKEKIFNRHVRGTHANDFSPLGSGLGLYLARKIVNSLGGSLVLVTEKHKTSFILSFKK